MKLHERLFKIFDVFDLTTAIICQNQCNQEKEKRARTIFNAVEKQRINNDFD
jgi:hypothetical protein